jgi:hypothetical protein
MRKQFISVIFIFLFFVSCSGNFVQDESACQPSETPSAPPLRVHEPMSVVFMEETITAPDSYTGVPYIYAPVLDDAYLFGALQQRWSGLHTDERTQEARREFEHVRGEIRQRGHLPFPGDGGRTAGFALIDLDGDGFPELLLLGNIHDGQIPSIGSIHTARDGQLVCVYNGSSELYMGTILASDGTFYQTVGWRGTGYTTLRSFRLEAEMTEFTTLMEVRASLSFDKGDVPVPYWVKNENGGETYITEEEFYTLYEMFKNTESIVLDFTALYPNRTNHVYSQQRVGLTPPTQIDFPQSYKGAPIEYKPILDALYLVSERIRRWETDDLFDFDCFSEAVSALIVGESLGGDMGYAVIDINNDGIPELLIGHISSLEYAAPCSIFTLKDGEPVLLANFWSRSRGIISADGIIYVTGSGGAAHTYLSSYELHENADTLTQLTAMHSDYSQEAQRPYYINAVNGRNRFISEKEFWSFGTSLNRMVLKVIQFPSL